MRLSVQLPFESYYLGATPPQIRMNTGFLLTFYTFPEQPMFNQFIASHIRHKSTVGFRSSIYSVPNNLSLLNSNGLLRLSRNFHIMGDQNQGCSELFHYLLQQGHCSTCGLRIQIPRWLICKYDAGIMNHGSGNRDTYGTGRIGDDALTELLRRSQGSSCR